MRAALVVAGLSFACAAHAEVKVEYDKFSDRTTVAFTGRMTWDGPDSSFVGVSAVVAGKSPRRPSSVAVVFTSDSRQGRFSCSSVIYLADGARISAGTSQVVGAASRKSVSESVVNTLPWNQVKRLAAATSVEAQVCRSAYTFSADDMDNLRELVRTLDK